MPREEYGSITIKKETYNEFLSFYEDRKEDYKKKGITSFTGFVVSLLYAGLGREMVN